MEGIACAPCFDQAGAPNHLPENIDALPCGYDSGAGPASKWRIVGVQSAFLLREGLSHPVGLLLRFLQRRLRHAGSHVRHRLATWLLRHKPGTKECSMWICSELYEYSREQPAIHLSKPQWHDVEVLRG